MPIKAILGVDEFYRRLGVVTEWRVVPEYPEFEISDYGHLRRCQATRRNRAWRLYPPYWDPDGYVRFSVRHVPTAAHRLVLATYVGPSRQETPFACHINGVRDDNWVGNLRWGTPKENYDDMLRHGNQNWRSGSANHYAKLSEEQVLLMLRRRGEGAKLAALAKEFGVTMSAAHMVCARKTWKHVG